MKNRSLKVLAVAMSIVTVMSVTGCSLFDNKSGNKSDLETDETTVSDADFLDATVDEVANIKDSYEYTDWTTEEYTVIEFNGDAINIQGSGAMASNSVVTISDQGVYVLSGTLDDGYIVVDAEKSDDIRLVCNGVSITSNDYTALYVKKADKVIVSLENGTENSFTDGKYATDDDNPSAAIYSKADLIFNGTGTINVTGNTNDGIQSKDDLKILDGVYNVTAVDDGIIGKDMVAIISGEFVINSGGDGIKSTKKDTEGKGIVCIKAGRFNITSGGEGIQAKSNMLIEGGAFTIVADGGIENAAAHPGLGGNTMMDAGGPGGFNNGWSQSKDTDTSDKAEEETTGAKGIIAQNYLVIKGGSFNIDTSNDAIHCNGIIRINGGDILITAGDDGIHADTQLIVDYGSITINNCYEGLESEDIQINDGNINIVATDDGVNAAGGETISGNGGMAESAGYLTINGGKIFVNAAGDGLDANSGITMTGGDVTVEGPTDSGNGALDYNNSFEMTGGTLLAVGSSGMLQTISDSSTVTCLTVVYTTSQQAETDIIIKDANGDEVLNYKPGKTYQSFVYATANLHTGETYSVYSDDTCLTDVTLSNTVTTIRDSGEATNATGGFGGMGNNSGGMRGGM